MKTLLLSSAKEMNTPALRQLTVHYENEDNVQVEAETISHPVQFTATDMWNRHRNMRSASDLVRKWNLN
jgi:hypothetical protein